MHSIIDVPSTTAGTVVICESGHEVPAAAAAKMAKMQSIAEAMIEFIFISVRRKKRSDGQIGREDKSR